LKLDKDKKPRILNLNPKWRRVLELHYHSPIYRVIK
jgi:hypothetical protein